MIQACQSYRGRNLQSLRRIKSPYRRLISMDSATLKNRPDHALPTYVLMACIKSVFTAVFTNRRNWRILVFICFLQLAQPVKIRTMRPTVDNVYSRRRFVLPRIAHNTRALFTCGIAKDCKCVGFLINLLISLTAIPPSSRARFISPALQLDRNSKGLSNPSLPYLIYYGLGSAATSTPRTWWRFDARCMMLEDSNPIRRFFPFPFSSSSLYSSESSTERERMALS